MRNGEMAARASRAISCAVAALAIASSLGACGSSGGASSTVAVAGPLADAAYATSQAGGAHMSVTAQIEAAGLPSAVTMSGSGFFSYSSHEGALSLTLAGLPTSVAGGSPLQMEEIFKGTDIYVGSALLAGKLPGGARWMKLDLARFASAAGVDPAQLLGGQSNPAQLLEYLKASGGSVQTVGRETLRGVPTIHYHGTIDVKKAARVLAGRASNSSLREKFEQELAHVGLSSLPVDVWIDSHHLVRRIELSLSIPTAGHTASTRMAIELFGFGATPAVNAPPANETFDATSSALGGVGSLSG